MLDCPPTFLTMSCHLTKNGKEPLTALQEAIRDAREALRKEDKAREMDETQTRDGRMLDRYEQACVASIKAAGWTVLRVTPTHNGEIRQIVVTGDGDLEKLTAALSTYLLQTPFLFVQAIIEGPKRFQVQVSHNGCRDNDRQLEVKLGPLSNFGTYRERQKACAGDAGIDKYQERFRVRVTVDGTRHWIGVYKTMDAARAAKKAFLCKAAGKAAA